MPIKPEDRGRPDIVTILRAAAVIPDDIQPVKFRQLLFDAAELIERLRVDAKVADRGAARNAETITDLREALAAYRISAEDDTEAER